MYVSQVVMASLPNIEIVSLLILLTTCCFGVAAMWSVAIFVGCEIITYGIGIWSVNYLYVWAVLCLILLPLRKVDSAVFYALIAGLFGLLFGTLCSLPYFLTGGFSFGISYIISGLWFDLVHGVGNFILTLLLYRPLKKALQKALKTHTG